MFMNIHMNTYIYVYTYIQTYIRIYKQSALLEHRAIQAALMVDNIRISKCVCI
jgi:hypothetical protein